MAKARVQYVCTNCGTTSPKWMGKCPGCSAWNTFVEEKVTAQSKGAYTWDGDEKASSGQQPLQLSEVHEADLVRIDTHNQELNRVLGGGIVPGALMLIGGEPGIGKSTLMMQIALSNPALKILYVSGEESAQQLKLRANRIEGSNDNLFLYTETDTTKIFNQCKKLEPQLLIVDSIQTLHAAKLDATPGTVTQIRECTGELQRFAKETNTPVFVIGHITKEGTIAGPKLLEHMVDVVLQFEGDNNYTYRLIRTSKNRFGSTAELGIYEMLHSGLREVANPSEILLTQRDEPVSGVAIAATMEGQRSLLIETQGLVANAFYGTPQRSATGYNSKRLNMLLAVLEKRAGFAIGNKDVFLNLAGGIKADDPAMDLAVIAALMSSYEDHALSDHIVFAGEVGLSGEIRTVPKLDQRIKEAAKLGFEKIYVSKYSAKSVLKHPDIQVVPVAKVADLYQLLL